MLEWACAAVQLSRRCEDDEEATEEEEMEAITPEGSLREWNEGSVLPAQKLDMFLQHIRMLAKM